MPAGNRSPVFTTSGVIYNDQVTVASVTAGTATGASGAVSAADWAQLRLSARNVSFVGGTTPTLTPIVQHSPDGSTWTDIPAGQGQFPGAVSAGATMRAIMFGLDRYVRVRWTCTGTPTSVSFIVDGEGV